MEFFKSIQDDVRARFRSSFLVSFFVSFCVLNWKALYFLAFDPSGSKEKFTYFDTNTSLQSLLYDPLLFGFLIAIIAPFLDAPAHRVTSIAKNWMAKVDEENQANRAFSLEELKLKNDNKIELKKQEHASDVKRLQEKTEMRTRIRIAKAERVEAQAIEKSEIYQKVLSELEEEKRKNANLSREVVDEKLRMKNYKESFVEEVEELDAELIQALENESYWDELSNEIIKVLSLVMEYGPDNWVPLSEYARALQSVSTQKNNSNHMSAEERNKSFQNDTRQLILELNSNGSIEIGEGFDSEERVNIRIRPLGVLALQKGRDRASEPVSN